ncbi:MAG: nicotinate (nicotinamide) nucleotide adenylyltransferase [Candidatus Pacebacteria bacterium]|nr:nicotinate (nicotinamide) nucleotide adenylyltransferase [Candidatus Paceibacterota bacterium]
MNVTLFGGAFDPPHLGHQAIAIELVAQQLADEVWFLPVKMHAFEKDLSSEVHRLAMLELLQIPHTRVELAELEQTTTNYTYQTLTALAAKYPEHTFNFVIGSDNLKKFHLWDEYQKLITEFPFFVYPRAGYLLDPLYRNMKVIPKVQPVLVSSTQVRECVAAGKSISDLVHPFVERYIQNNNLYVKRT